MIAFIILITLGCIAVIAICATSDDGPSLCHCEKNLTSCDYDDCPSRYKPEDL